MLGGTEGATDAEISKYDEAMASYRKAETGTLLMLTTNMSEDTLKKVMRYKKIKGNYFNILTSS